MSDTTTTCSNCGLKYDSDEPDCTHCHFTIVERDESSGMSREEIEDEFDF